MPPKPVTQTVSVPVFVAVKNGQVLFIAGSHEYPFPPALAQETALRLQEAAQVAQQFSKRKVAA